MRGASVAAGSASTSCRTTAGSSSREHAAAMTEDSAQDLARGWGLSPRQQAFVHGAGVNSEHRDPRWDEALKVMWTRGLAVSDSHSIDFPDEPRGELDLALDNLVARARDVLKIQGRLR